MIVLFTILNVKFTHTPNPISVRKALIVETYSNDNPTSTDNLTSKEAGRNYNQRRRDELRSRHNARRYRRNEQDMSDQDKEKTCNGHDEKYCKKSPKCGWLDGCENENLSGRCVAHAHHKRQCHPLYHENEDNEAYRGCTYTTHHCSKILNSFG